MKTQDVLLKHNVPRATMSENAPLSIKEQDKVSDVAYM